MNNINNVDLNLLKSLQALLTEQHVGKAAERMNISQSAMSHTLARLRKTFDDPLFIRTSKGLEPTGKALEVSDKLSILLIEIDHLFERSEFNPAKAQHRFCLQTHDFISATHLPKVFADIRLKAPGIIFDITTITDNTYSQLESGKVDLVIGAGIQAKSKFMQRGLCEEELVCLLDKNHPALNNWNTKAIFQFPHIKLSVLDERDDPISQYAKINQTGSEKIASEKIASEKIAARKIGLHTQTLHMQPYVISGTQLIAFVPKSVADIGVKLFDLTIRPIPFDVPTLPIRAIWHERSQQNPIHQWIREQLATQLSV